MKTAALLWCIASTLAQETAPRKVEFEAVVDEEGTRAAFSWTKGEDVTEKATAYCEEHTKEELWERCVAAVKGQVAASLMETELPAMALEVQVGEETTATFAHVAGGDLRKEAHAFCAQYVEEDKIPVCAHHLVQGVVQKAGQLADGPSDEDTAAAAAAAGGAAAASKAPPQKQTKPVHKPSPTQRTPSDWARLVGPALVSRGGATTSADVLENKKNVAFLFAADWCKPCRDFVPKLIDYYNLAKRKGDDKLEILWVSASRSQQAFDAYLEEMPWPAAPFPLAGRLVQAFQQKGHAKGFPTLCFMDTSSVGSVINCDGVQQVMADQYGLSMPYRSPVQKLTRMIRGVTGAVKALLRVFGVGKTK